MKNPMEISQIHRRIYLAATTAASTLLPSPNPTQMDLGWHGFTLKWRFLVLFMEFSSLLMEFSNEEMGERRKLDQWRKMRERRKRKKIHWEREREEKKSEKVGMTSKVVEIIKKEYKMII